MIGTPANLSVHDIVLGDYRFRYHFGPADRTSWYSCDWLLGGVSVERKGKTWRAFVTKFPSEHGVVRNGDKPVIFRTAKGAAKYLVEAITAKKVRG